MDSRSTDKTDDQAVAETPEDVAVLYSWANLHGAKYRDFSASRREYRAQLRHRAAEQVREQALLAQAEAEAAAAAAESAARQAAQAARTHQAEEADSSMRRALREAEEAARTAAAERVEAARRAEAAAVAEAAARREEREIAEAHASAQRQAARYADSEIRRKALAETLSRPRPRSQARSQSRSPDRSPIPTPFIPPPQHPSTLNRSCGPPPNPHRRNRPPQRTTRVRTATASVAKTPNAHPLPHHRSVPLPPVIASRHVVRRAIIPTTHPESARSIAAPTTMRSRSNTLPLVRQGPPLPRLPRSAAPPRRPTRGRTDQSFPTSSIERNRKPGFAHGPTSHRSSTPHRSSVSGRACHIPGYGHGRPMAPVLRRSPLVRSLSRLSSS